MAHLVSSWSKTAKSVPEDYILQPELRVETDAPICKDIPVIDLSLAMGSEADRAKVADQILKALAEYRCFQVINNGVSEKLMEDAMDVYKEFFNLPIEDKEKYVSGLVANNINNGLYSGNDATVKINLWKDALVHQCYPLEKHIIDSWPDKPIRYRNMTVEYANGTTKVIQTIFKLIGEGLGLEKDVKFLENQTMKINYYPKCPDPSLTTGLLAHHDPNLATLLQQNVLGLQILKDGKWVFVEPLPNAFIFLTGMELQVISNGKFKALLHQVATNVEADRLSIGIFTSAVDPTAVEPDEAFVSSANPRKYKVFSYEEYNKRRFQFGGSLAAASEYALESFLLKN